VSPSISLQSQSNPESKQNKIYKKKEIGMKNKWKEENTGAIVCVWHWKGGPCVCARRSVVWERRHDEPLTHTNSANFRSVPSILLSHRTHVTHTRIQARAVFFRSFATVKLARPFFFFFFFFRFVFFLFPFFKEIITSQSARKGETLLPFFF
jgi:hypothetical protein